MKLDILAIAAHPDDAELSCSGILFHHKLQGKKIGILDLTQGELGSRGTIATRKKEAALASKVLQLDVRENLKMQDGFFEINKTNQLKIIEKIRLYQPEIVLINAPYDRHPDHGKGARLAQDACYLSGLLKIETKYKNKVQKHWRPKRVFHYMQDTFIEPDFLIDISDSMQAKLDSVKCYKTQFLASDKSGVQTYISSDSFFDTITARCIELGKRIGVKYAEGLIKCESSIGLNDLFDMVLPKIS
jgi:N-acetylglucosamine malate deacetylase 1